jgi:transcriptional regulator with XRE-family HTH domain
MPKSVFTPAYAAVLSRLTELRKQQGMSQVELARRLAKPQQFVSSIETGERRLDIVEFCAIARALDLDPVGVFAEIVQGFPKRFSI